MANSTEALGQYADVWKRKPVLRLIYEDFYDRLVAQCQPGLTIEIGGGIGNLKERLGEVVTTDIQFGRWLDCVADAQRLPFAASCAANIVMVDVLHHVEFPVAFFREVERVLRRGRIDDRHRPAGARGGSHGVDHAALDGRPALLWHRAQRAGRPGQHVVIAYRHRCSLCWRVVLAR